MRKSNYGILMGWTDQLSPSDKSHLIRDMPSVLLITTQQDLCLLPHVGIERRKCLTEMGSLKERRLEGMFI